MSKPLELDRQLAALGTQLPALIAVGVDDSS